MPLTTATLAPRSSSASRASRIQSQVTFPDKATQARSTYTTDITVSDLKTVFTESMAAQSKMLESFIQPSQQQLQSSQQQQQQSQQQHQQQQLMEATRLQHAKYRPASSDAFWPPGRYGTCYGTCWCSSSSSHPSSFSIFRNYF